MTSTNPPLIGLTGYAQHGKNSVADLLTESEGYVQVAFADALRALARIVNPVVQTEVLYAVNGEAWPVETRYAALVADVGYEAAKKVPEVRRFLQELGTGVRDVVGPEVWVQALGRTIAALPEEAKVVITDVRFPNEAAFVRRNGGEVWGVERLTQDGEMFDNGLGTDHPSEAYVAELLAGADFRLHASNLLELGALVSSVSGVRSIRDAARRAETDPALD